MFFSCPLLRARFENQPKIDPKTLRKRVARHIVCETRFFSCWRPQNDSQKSSRPPWGAPCGLLWRSWGTLGALRGTLGELLERSAALWDRSWGGLGALMRRSWALLSALGCFWALPGRFWLDFSPPEVDFGARFWTRNDQTWSHVWRSLRAFGKNVTTTVSVEATPIDAVSSELGVIQGGRRERLTTAWQQRRIRIVESETTTTMQQ